MSIVRRTRTLAMFFLTLTCLVANSAPAQEAKSYGFYPQRDTILLRSQKGHGGPCRWQMAQADKAGEAAALSQPGFTAPSWSDAIVPGTVLNSLVANGVYPEPYWGLNNARESKKIPDLSLAGPKFYTYWFRTEFNVPESFRGRRVWLQVDGINYRAEVWLNGSKVGTMAGMFERGFFDVTEQAKVGATNALAIRVTPVDVPGGWKNKRKKPIAVGENRNGGDGEIGRNVTMLMTVGWDFTMVDGIRDRNTGIWRDIKLYATGPIALRSPFVKSVLPIPDTSVAREQVLVDAINATSQPQEGVLKAAIPQLNLTIEKKVSLAPGETKTVVLTPEEFPQLVVRNPRLWWPVNKGEQFLHDLKLEFVQADKVSDRIASRFGIRDIRSDQNTPDKSRMFYVNGKRLFVHGTNWVPEAMCRTSDLRTWAELRYTQQSGVNFLRLWGGGVTESDQFYDLCDQMGILVWTEFWLTGDTQLPSDTELYRRNVADTVKRIRNHASNAYYVSANEREADKIIPIKDLLDKLDGTIGWQAGSETDGIHDGSPYQAWNPMFYYEDTASARGSRVNGFCPEYGCPILPTIDALREMMPEKDLWPINKTVWDYLDGGGFHQMTTEYDAAVKQYGPSKGIEEYAWKAQMFGALAHRALWEVWNYNRFEYGDRFCSGMLFWFHNSPNRQVCGRLYDWSLEPTAALYFTQKAHEPLHPQYDFIKNTVSVNNELVKSFKGYKLTARILNFDMSPAYEKSVTLDLPADRPVKDVIQVDLPANLTPVHFIRLDLANDKGKPVASNFYWRSNKEYKPKRTNTGPQFEGFEDINKLPRVDLQASVTPRNTGGINAYTVRVTNPGKSLAFMVWLRLQDKHGKPVRPAFYEDNFFSLLPGESRDVTIEYSTVKPDETKLLIDGWNVNRQVYSDRALKPFTGK